MLWPQLKERPERHRAHSPPVGHLVNRQAELNSDTQLSGTHHLTSPPLTAYGEQVNHQRTHTMTDTTYNGWTNRETWAIGLHLMDTVTEQIIDDIDNWAATDTVEACLLFHDYVDDMIEAADMNDLLLDLLDLSQVNWQELGEHALDAAFN